MGIVYIMGATLIWSMVPIAIKEILPVFSTTGIAFFRFLLAVVTLVAIHLVLRGGLWRQPSGETRDLGWFLLGGLGMTGNYLLYNLGLVYTTATTTNLLIQIEIIGLIILAWAVLKERVGRAKLMGVVASFLGMCLVAWNGKSLSDLFGTSQLLGNVSVIAAGFCWSFYGLSQKILFRSRSATGSLIPILALATLFTGITGLFKPMVIGVPDIIDLAILLALGSICTGACYLLLASGMRLMEASSAGVATSTLPLFTGIAAHFLLQEPITIYLLSGGALIVVGIALISAAAKQPLSSPPPPPDHSQARG